MEIVIDASAVLAVVLNEPTKAALVQLTSGADIVAPGSLPWEIGNALAAMLKRKRLDVATARNAYQSFDQIPIRLVTVDREAAIGVAAKHDMYAYDAYMLECAATRRAPLLTLDRGLIHAAKAAGVQHLEVKE